MLVKNISADTPHRYSVGATTYKWPPGEVRDVPNDIAALVCRSHPQKLVMFEPSETEPAQAVISGEVPEPEGLAEALAEYAAQRAAQRATDAANAPEPVEDRQMETQVTTQTSPATTGTRRRRARSGGTVQE
jgi:hypothetical protein